MKQFAFISIAVIIGGLGILFIALKPYQQPGCGIRDFETFCGTNAFYDAPSAEGKQIFNSNCAACHKLDKHMTGPALRGMAKAYDTIILTNYIRGNKSLIEGKNFNNTCVNFPNLTEQEILYLIQYTR